MDYYSLAVNFLKLIRNILHNVYKIQVSTKRHENAQRGRDILIGNWLRSIQAAFEKIKKKSL